MINDVVRVSEYAFHDRKLFLIYKDREALFNKKYNYKWVYTKLSIIIEANYIFFPVLKIVSNYKVKLTRHDLKNQISVLRLTQAFNFFKLRKKWNDII